MRCRSRDRPRSTRRLRSLRERDHSGTLNEASRSQPVQGVRLRYGFSPVHRAASRFVGGYGKVSIKRSHAAPGIGRAPTHQITLDPRGGGAPPGGVFIAPWTGGGYQLPTDRRLQRRRERHRRGQCRVRAVSDHRHQQREQHPVRIRSHEALRDRSRAAEAQRDCADPQPYERRRGARQNSSRRPAGQFPPGVVWRRHGGDRRQRWRDGGQPSALLPKLQLGLQ